MKRCRTAVFLLTGLSGLANFASAADASPTLCRNDERTVFACRSGNDDIAICSSKNLGLKTGYVHLRMGSPTALQINGPGAPANPATKPNSGTRGITKGQLFYAGAVGHYVRFRSKGSSFIAFGVKGKDEKSSAHGLVTEKSAAIVGKRLCQSVQSSELNSLPVPISDVYVVSGIR